MRTALTIAGSDPSGGAGIQGDLKTFHGHGVYGMAVLTALTAQNTRGVTGVHDVPAAFVAAQLRSVFDDLRVDAAKTGMLSVPETIEVVAAELKAAELPHLVVDPVMVATSGDSLLRDDAVALMVERLFPLASLITPNLPEAERLCGFSIGDSDGMRHAAAHLHELGARGVLIKGGHLEGGTVIDLLSLGGEGQLFEEPRIDAPPIHGTGCALAAGIAAQLALGAPMMKAIESARSFVRRGIERSRDLGGGARPLNHLEGSR